MQLVFSGEASDIERYERLVKAFVEHYDKIAVGSAYQDPNLKHGRYPLDVLKGAYAPSSSWTFRVQIEDDDFGMWFKLKYA